MVMALEITIIKRFNPACTSDIDSSKDSLSLFNHRDLESLNGFSFYSTFRVFSCKINPLMNLLFV